MQGLLFVGTRTCHSSDIESALEYDFSTKYDESETIYALKFCYNFHAGNTKLPIKTITYIVF